jgi:hypothetical protein
MRKLTHFAMLMYPPEWRQRYGVELQCLLEDSGSPRLQDILDILKGGLIMRYTGNNVFRMAITWGISCAVVGALAAGVAALLIPDRYVAETTLVGRWRGPQDGAGNRPASDEEMNAVAARAITDDRMARIIAMYGLYGFPVSEEHPYQVGQDPAQDLAMQAKVSQFRQDIRLGLSDPNTRVAARFANGSTNLVGHPNGILPVLYRSENGPLSAQVANQIAATIAQEGLKDSAGTGFRVTIASPARVPAQPYFPNRLAIAMLGLVAGIPIGITIALVRRRSMQLAS